MTAAGAAWRIEKITGASEPPTLINSTDVAVVSLIYLVLDRIPPPDATP
ncbi:MAG: hypothetical protein Kow00109_22490 [Acidobacteriota bacterium]